MATTLFGSFMDCSVFTGVIQLTDSFGEFARAIGSLQHTNTFVSDWPAQCQNKVVRL